MSFPARYQGYCAAGEDRIDIGDQILYDGEGGIVHETCQKKAASTKPVQICPTCHMTLPCECD